MHDGYSKLESKLSSLRYTDGWQSLCLHHWEFWQEFQQKKMQTTEVVCMG